MTSDAGLRDSEEQLRLATEAADVGLWDLDMATDTLYWPARVKAMFGISADSPVSMVDYYSGLHPDDRDSQLTGGVALDFNNLLMVISGGLNLLERPIDPERQKRIIAQMRQAAGRGASLSRQLLAFARRQPLTPESIDLHRQIEGMREVLDREDVRRSQRHDPVEAPARMRESRASRNVLHTP